jgi:folate-binding Fe-S cluster repair protein YgfZ
MKAELGEKPGALEFSGPDAVRFLNGQITQDVRKVMGTGLVLPSCVTDAKGKLQFRVWIAEGCGGVLVICREGMTEDLEARLTRYLIADDVEVRDVSDNFRIEDFGFSEMDEAERIAAGIPKWGAELKEGMLPPEAGLDATDISYNKGCYIGQEVISRIKSAGKVNRRLTKFVFESEGITGEITNIDGKVCGEVTSASGQLGLGYLKRSTDEGTALFVAGSPVKTMALS